MVVFEHGYELRGMSMVSNQRMVCKRNEEDDVSVLELPEVPVIYFFMVDLNDGCVEAGIVDVLYVILLSDVEDLSLPIKGNVVLGNGDAP